jgi:hypothetical protein
LLLLKLANPRPPVSYYRQSLYQVTQRRKTKREEVEIAVQAMLADWDMGRETT